MHHALEGIRNGNITRIAKEQLKRSARAGTASVAGHELRAPSVPADPTRSSRPQRYHQGRPPVLSIQSCQFSSRGYCHHNKFSMRYSAASKLHTGIRRLQQPRALISSSTISSGSSTQLALPRIPGQLRSRHVPQSVSWDGASNSYGNNQGNAAAAGHAGPADNSSKPRYSTSNGTGSASQWPTGSTTGFTPSPGSTWEEEGSSGWQDFQNVDWGQTYQAGDWGEAGSIGMNGSNGSNQQQQQQQGQQNGFGPMAENTSGFSSNSAGGFYRDPQPQQQQQPQGDSRWPFADSTQQQQQPGGSVRSPMMPSDITLLGRRDAVSMWDALMCAAGWGGKCQDSLHGSYLHCMQHKPAGLAEMSTAQPSCCLLVSLCTVCDRTRAVVVCRTTCCRCSLHPSRRASTSHALCQSRCRVGSSSSSVQHVAAVVCQSRHWLSARTTRWPCGLHEQLVLSSVAHCVLWIS